jgi:hypothetical protein
MRFKQYDIVKATIAFVATITGTAVFAHAGGLNAKGCHTEKKTGEYHCHQGRSTPPQTLKAAVKPRQQTQKNFSAASKVLPPGCYVGPRGGTYTITKSGRKNYGGC